MFFFDPMYFVLLAPALLFAMWAQFKVKHNFEKYGRVRPSSGMSGADAAHQMLQHAGLAGRVKIERVQGHLSDHYDPRHKVLRLSPEVYEGRSLSAVGVACHEAGHAIQDAKNYAPLVLRNAIVPTASIGSSLGIILIFAGFILRPLAIIGLLLFATVVVFQLINLPVEFNASSRAKKMLNEMGVISGRQEAAGVSNVLSAAAMTYVAATVTAILTLLYYATLVLGRR